jgi:hypothetical protein
MDRNVLYMIASLAALYYLLDDFIGKKKISTLVEGWFNASTAAAPITPPSITDKDVQAGISKTPQTGGTGTGQTPERSGIVAANFKPSTSIVTTI